MEINEFAKMNYARAMANHPSNARQYGTWEYFLVGAAGEAGEALEHLKKYWRGDPNSDPGENEIAKDEICEEIVDKITYGFLAISALGRDAEKEILKKFEKVNRRLAAGGFDKRPE